MNLFVFLFWSIYGVSLTQAFNCYECWSLLIPGCGEPFNPNAPGIIIKAAASNESCGALRETDVDGRESIARAVVDLTMCSFGENTCHAEVVENGTKTMCCCSSDLCNGRSFAPETTTAITTTTITTTTITTTAITTTTITTTTITTTTITTTTITTATTHHSAGSSTFLVSTRLIFMLILHFIMS